MPKRAPVSVRFWAKVERGSDAECWLWRGSRRKDGYGRFGQCPLLELGA